MFLSTGGNLWSLCTCSCTKYLFDREIAFILEKNTLYEPTFISFLELKEINVFYVISDGGQFLKVSLIKYGDSYMYILWSNCII